MHTVEIPITDPKNPPKMKFPDRCVNCGKPKVVILPMKISMGVQKRGQEVLMDFPVPLCAECERKEKRVTMVTLIPFLIGGFITGAIAFVPAWLVAPQGTTPQTLNFDIAFAGFIGLIVGLIGGTVVEVAVKFLCAPLYGRLILKRPLSVVSFFNDSEDIVGISEKFTKGRKALRLTFENDEIAREFEQLNRN